MRIGVIGGGIIGLAVARELLQRRPAAEVTLFEKEGRVGVHQTGRNSGVVHAGLYYEPERLKARLCRRGVGLLEDFAHEKGVSYQRCGKIVVATNETERDRLRSIHARAVANGVPGVEVIDAAAIAEIEPAARGIAALHSPETAIVDYGGIARGLVEDIAQAGGELRLGTEVCAVDEDRDGPSQAPVRVRTPSGEERFDHVIACAGLQSDRLARRSGESRYPAIVPFFGEYLHLTAERAADVNGLIYPVPDPRYPFLGVHITRRYDGEVLLGPNAFLSAGREVYRRPGFNFRDTAEVASFPGFWRFAGRNIPAAWRETRTALSRRAFVNEARRYMSGIGPADVLPGSRGIRAQAMHADGALADDFVITGSARVAHVRNAPSPGATSSLAIAEHIVAESLSRRGLQ